jgi:hypothetical protein
MSNVKAESPVLDAFESVVAASLAATADERAVGVNLVIDIRRKRTEANMIASPAWMLGVAPLLPQLVQREAARSLSLEALAPHRMTATAQANGV